MFNDLDTNLDVAIQREKEFIKDALK